MNILDKIFKKKLPSVSCPKCKTLHELNPDSTCPNCGLKYKLPEEVMQKYFPVSPVEETQAFEQKSESEMQASKNTPSFNDRLEGFLKKTKLSGLFSGRTLALTLGIAGLFVVFTILVFVLFRDNDPLLFKLDEYKNQPVFYLADDDELNVHFPNGKGATIGKGSIGTYLSSTDGKRVYLTFSGEPENSDTESEYVIEITKYGKKIRTVAESKHGTPLIVSGGDNEYLYILTPQKDDHSLYTLSLSHNGGKPKQLHRDVKEIAVSPSGKYAFISADTNGASILKKYCATSKEFTKPGIRNAHPLSIDNKGEYLIYSKRASIDETVIIAQTSSTDKIEIPIMKESLPRRILFTQDRRAFILEYDTKTMFYKCGNENPDIVETYWGSQFGYDVNENVCHNVISFTDIPSVSDIYGTSLYPYYYYDTEKKDIYCIIEGSTRTPIFKRTLDSVKISDNGYAAFVCDNKLFCGRLDADDPEITDLGSFKGNTLMDITPDGELIYYSDEDGNLFYVNYGKRNDKAVKLAVDAQIVKYDADGEKALICSDGDAKFTTNNGKTELLCKDIIPEESVVCSDDLSKLFYVKTGDSKSEKLLYLYAKKKSVLVSDEFKCFVAADDTKRLDRTASYYIDVNASNGVTDTED